MTKTETAPGIGTPEGAVRACVALIASVTGQPEELTERYLDLYYQVRRQAEDAAERDRILRCWDVGTPMTVVPSDGPPRAQGESAQIAERRRPGPSAPTEKTETERPAAKTGPSVPPSTAEAVPLPQARQAAGGGKGKKVDFEEVLASASAGARMPPEKQKNQPWGSVKREIRERFLDLRAKGMSIAQTVNLSGKKLTDGDVMNIMNGGKAEMKIYNTLEDAMNKWEQITREQITTSEPADEKEGA